MPRSEPARPQRSEDEATRIVKQLACRAVSGWRLFVDDEREIALFEKAESLVKASIQQAAFVEEREIIQGTPVVSRLPVRWPGVRDRHSRQVK